MCGRFSIATDLDELRERFNAELPVNGFRVRYNAAPGQLLPVITMQNNNQMELFRWGLIPIWAKDPNIGSSLINARAETVADKPAFRESFRHYRCLVPADGFYEWDKKKEVHQPYRITLKNHKAFAFAGLCGYWKSGDREISSFSIITTRANKLIGKIHERMPVILEKKNEKLWLNEHLDPQKAIKLLRIFPAEKMELYPISTFVNNPRNDVLEVMKAIE